MDSNDFKLLIIEYLELQQKLSKKNITTEIETVYSLRGANANIFIKFDERGKSNDYKPDTPDKNNTYFYGRAQVYNDPDKSKKIAWLCPGPNAVRNTNYKIDEKKSDDNVKTKNPEQNLLGKKLLALPIYDQDIRASNWSKRTHNSVFIVAFDKFNNLRLYSSQLQENVYKLPEYIIKNKKSECRAAENAILTKSTFAGAQFKSLYKYLKWLSSQQEVDKVQYIKKEPTDSLDIIDNVKSLGESFHSNIRRVTLDGNNINQFCKESDTQHSQIAYLEQNCTLMKKESVETSNLYKKEMSSFRIAKKNEMKSFHRNTLVHYDEFSHSNDGKCQVNNEYPVDCVVSEKSGSKNELLLEYPPDYYLHENNYLGFRINAKTEENVEDIDEKRKILKEMFGGKHTHTYRYKKRFTFVYVYNGIPLFNIDLTMIKTGSDRMNHSNPIFQNKLRPTPFIAFKQLRESEERYELEIEYLPSSKLKVDEITSIWQELIYQCKKGIYGYSSLFPNNEFLPDIIEDTSDDTNVSRLDDILCNYHKASCHIQHDKHSHLRYDIFTNIGPRVVSIVKEKFNFMKSSPTNFSLMVKTDGYRCMGYIKDSKLFLFLQNMNLCIPFNIPTIENIDECIIDGEFWTGPNKVSYYFIFDAYYVKKNPKGHGKNLMFDGLYQRLGMIKTLHNIFASNKLGQDVLKLYIKTPLPICKEKLNYESDEFKCIVEDNIPEKDGYIITHTGPIIEDLKPSEVDNLVGVMTKEQFDNPSNISNISKQSSEIMFIKWKPKEQCTIDFRLEYNPKSAFDQNVEVTLQSKYNPYHSFPLNLYTILKKKSEKIIPDTIDEFVPYEPYEYELGYKTVSKILLPCTDKGLVITENKEIVKPGDIVEMQYTDKPNQIWKALKHRPDKSEPNVIQAALDNWRNLHYEEIPEPMLWEDSIETTESLDFKRYYRVSNNQQKREKNNFNPLHRRFMQYLIYKTAEQWKSKKIQILDLGCGRGSDLISWNRIHESPNHANIGFYLGIENDMNNLMDQRDGAYSRYYSGKSHNKYIREIGFPYKYTFPALMLQGNCREAFQHNFKQTKNESENKEETQHPEKVTWSDFHSELYKYLWNNDYVNPYLQQSTKIQEYKGRCLQKFEIISIQMAIHHLYDSEHFWTNIKQSLHEKGVVIATVPNGDKIKEMLLKNKGVYNIPEIGIKYKTHTNPDKVWFSTSKINLSDEPLFIKEKAQEYSRQHELDIEIIPFHAFVGEPTSNSNDSPLNIYYTYGSNIELSSGHRIKLVGNETDIMSDYKRFIPKKDKVVIEKKSSIEEIREEKYAFPNKNVNIYSKEFHSVVLIKHSSNVSSIFNDLVETRKHHKKGGMDDDYTDTDVENNDNALYEVEDLENQLESKTISIPPLDLSFLERDFVEESTITIVK